MVELIPPKCNYLKVSSLSFLHILESSSTATREWQLDISGHTLTSTWEGHLTRQEDIPGVAYFSPLQRELKVDGTRMSSSKPPPRCAEARDNMPRTHQRKTTPRWKIDLYLGNVGNSAWTRAKLAAFLLSVVFIVRRENSWCLKPIRSYKKFLSSLIHYEINESKTS